MNPVLFKIGDFTFYVYGLTTAVGFLSAFALMFYEAKKAGHNLDRYYDMALIALVSGILGARLLYIIVNFERYSGDMLKMLNLREGGLVWYGGVITTSVCIYLYTRWKDETFYKISDVMVPALSLGLAIGRIGCLSSGCCYGKQTSLPWGIMYPQNHKTPTELVDVHVHPSPIYESIFSVLLALFLMKMNRSKKFDGQTTWLYFLIYGAGRFTLEFLRGDPLRGFVIPEILSTSQLISIPIIVLAIYMLVRLKKKSSGKSPAR